MTGLAGICGGGGVEVPVGNACGKQLSSQVTSN